jgi:hypothetical protein
LKPADGPIDAAQREDAAQRRQRRHPSAPETDGVNREVFRPDAGGLFRHMGGDVDLETGGPRGARHAQAVGEEIPVLSDDIEDARQRPRAGIKSRWPPDL